MKAVVAAFNQEKALVGAFSVITNLRMELFQALTAIASAATWNMLSLVTSTPDISAASHWDRSFSIMYLAWWGHSVCLCIVYISVFSFFAAWFLLFQMDFSCHLVWHPFYQSQRKVCFSFYYPFWKEADERLEKRQGGAQGVGVRETSPIYRIKYCQFYYLLGKYLLLRKLILPKVYG